MGLRFKSSGYQEFGGKLLVPLRAQESYKQGERLAEKIDIQKGPGTHTANHNPSWGAPQHSTTEWLLTRDFKNGMLAHKPSSGCAGKVRHIAESKGNSGFTDENLFHFPPKLLPRWEELTER